MWQDVAVVMMQEQEQEIVRGRGLHQIKLQ